MCPPWTEGAHAGAPLQTVSCPYFYERNFGIRRYIQYQKEKIRGQPIILSPDGLPKPTCQPGPRYDSAMLRQGIISRCFPVHAKAASLLALSRVIKASRPSLTREVFSLMLVNSAALPSN